MTVGSPLCVDKNSQNFMYGMNESFLLNVTPRNLHTLTTGILESSIFKTGSLSIFLREQKCMHLVLDLENLNPFSLAHLFTLFKFSWSCHSTIFI